MEIWPALLTIRVEGTAGRKGDIVIRTLTAAFLVAACALVPFAAGGGPKYTAACSAHSVTFGWPGGTDVTATTGSLTWADGSKDAFSFALPKQGGPSTHTWSDLGTQANPLREVEATFYRNNGNVGAGVAAFFCSP